VTTLFGKEQELRALPPPPFKAELEDLRGRVAAQAERVKEAKGVSRAGRGLAGPRRLGWTRGAPAGARARSWLCLPRRGLSV
jgi:hypothetical protein